MWGDGAGNHRYMIFVSSKMQKCKLVRTSHKGRSKAKRSQALQTSYGFS